MWHFKHTISSKHNKGFTLLEVIAATALLAIVVSTVLVVVNDFMISTMDTKSKMIAFNIARENMETILAKNIVEEFVEYGYDELNPDIEWETEVKSFTEPVNSDMWIVAKCSAWYTDSNSERQAVELTHWITGLSADDIKKIEEQEKLLSGEDPEDEDNVLTFERLKQTVPDMTFWPMMWIFMPEEEAAKAQAYYNANNPGNTPSTTTSDTE